MADSTPPVHHLAGHIRPHRVPGRPIGVLHGTPGGRAPEVNPDDRTTYTSSSSLDEAPDTEHTRFDPSITDVQAVAEILDTVLVPDLTPTVLQLARYWVRETAERNTQMMVNERDAGRVYVRTRELGFSKKQSENHTASTSDEASQEEDLTPMMMGGVDGHSEGHVKMVVFTARSHDQGWSDNRGDWGTYKNSYTWFEVAIKRAKSMESESAEASTTARQDVAAGENPDKDNDEDETETVAKRHLFTNVHCAARDTIHTITWSADLDATSITSNNPQPTEQHEQQQDAKTDTQPMPYTDEDRLEIQAWLKQIRPGDRIEILPRARFPGWTNNVAGCRVDVYCGA